MANQLDVGIVVNVPFRVMEGQGHQSITLGTGVYSMWIPKGAKCVMIQSTAQNARITMDGTTPSAAVGFQLVAAAAPVIFPINEHTAFKLFREASGAIVQYQFGE